MTSLNITAVERDTGIAKETLRVWERRYGFPSPQRDAHGERRYPAEQLDRLRRIKRLMDGGHRPGRLMQLSDAEFLALEQAAQPLESDRATLAEIPPQTLLAALQGREPLRRYLYDALTRDGLARFVRVTVPALNLAVGDAWARGDIEVFSEHLYTEQLQTLLRQSIAALPNDPHGPRLLLTTVPDEQHGLGLLLLEAELTMGGGQCISLGTQTPLADIVQAARHHEVAAVALSFSAAFAPRAVPSLMADLRARLPHEIALWAGGAALLRLDSPPGVLHLSSLEEARAALATLPPARAE